MAIGYYRCFPTAQPCSRAAIVRTRSPVVMPERAFGLYVRAILAALGAVILMGPGVARLVGRLKGSGSDSERPSGLGC